MRSRKAIRGLVALPLLFAAIVTACQKTLATTSTTTKRTTVSYAEDFAADTRPAGSRAEDRSGSQLCNPFALARDSMPSVCMPCTHPEAQALRGAALQHARNLWLLRGSAPYDVDMKPGSLMRCVWKSYEQAIAFAPQDLLVRTEFASIKLISTSPYERANALTEIDTIVDHFLLQGEPKLAVNAELITARTMWTTALRMLERPDSLEWLKEEREFHSFASSAKKWINLPEAPLPSDRLGTSEAMWVSALFARAARLSSGNPAMQASLVRDAIMPFVTMRNWKAADSVASSFHDVPASDSITRVAFALTSYKRSKNSLDEQKSNMRMFDDALAHMPRADSARYDSFDGLLGTADDNWRYEHMPYELRQLDLRGWSLFDPLWSTPVNEVRLAHRARAAEADFLYGDDASFDQSGSQTPAGIMLMERGAPEERWHLDSRVVTIETTNERRVLDAVYARSWNGYKQTIRLSRPIIQDVEELYESRRSVQFVARFEHFRRLPTEYPCNKDRALRTFVACAQSEMANWNDVPYVHGLDTIDVSVARFRNINDGAQMYVSARVPLRRFTLRANDKLPTNDSIRTSLWIATPTGDSILHVEHSHARPMRNEVDYRTEFRVALAPDVVMHRVEAIDVAAAKAARGGALFTEDGAAPLPTSGFGVSDILVAESATPTKPIPKSWRDFETAPNGASVLPRSTFAMLWEVYDLKPDNTGRVRWRVSVRTEKGRKLDPSVRATIAAGKGAATQIAKNESDAPQMSFIRDALAAPTIVDQVNYGLADSPPGRHVLQVQVDDLVSGKSITRTVSVRVIDPKLQRRLSSID